MSTLRNISIAGFVVATLLSAGTVLAEEKSTNTVRETAKENLQSAREEVKTRSETVREEAKNKAEAVREEAKKRIETARESAKARIETQREKAKERLNDIRDNEKKQKVERLTEQFDNLNKKWTDNFIQQLDKLSSILIKIQERTDIAETNGKDTTAVNSAMQSAKTAITNAQTAVTAQASKTYTLNASSITATSAITTSSGQEELIKSLRTQFQNLHKTLFKDLYALRDGVMKDARKAVQDALQTLGKIPKVDDDNTASTDESN